MLPDRFNCPEPRQRHTLPRVANEWNKNSANSISEFSLPNGFTSLVFSLEGELRVGAEEQAVLPGQLAVLERRDHGPVRLHGARDARVLVLSGEPIDEPVVAYGPFVMNTREQILEAMRDYQSGKMGHLS